MLSIKATITVNLPAVSKEVKMAVIKGLTNGGLAVERKMKGYAPHDTGRLTASIAKSYVESAGEGFSISIGPNVFYGAIMEHPGGLGIKSQAKGAKRPYMQPALLESEKDIVNFIVDEIRKVC